jgi:glycosyltransferase involved in cell wall biosynthesis
LANSFQRRSVLYLSQTGMTEPLGRSQVVPYLRGLARAGWQIEVLAFEPEAARADEVSRVRTLLAADAIDYTALRRSPAHDVGTKVRESAAGLARVIGHALARRPRILHARATLPALVLAAATRLLPWTRLLFDCRGLVADEYVDFGHWQRESWKYRGFKLAERGLFARADGMVVLTDRMRRWLRDEARLVPPERPVEVIPCCVDLTRFTVDEAARLQARAQLGAGERFVLAYAGNLNSWYCDEEMAELFAAVRRRRPALFAAYTRSPTERLRAALARRGVPASDVHLASVAPDDMPAALAAADAAVSFAEPRFSKIASSPVKVAEYLASGLPVVVNRGVGDQDGLMQREPALLVDAGLMGERELDAAAATLLAGADDPERRARARRLAAARFDLDLGVARYRRLYEQLAD